MNENDRERREELRRLAAKKLKADSKKKPKVRGKSLGPKQQLSPSKGLSGRH